MAKHPHWPPEAWIPLLTGLAWLWRAPGHGVVGFGFSVIPGCLLLCAGVAMLLMPGDRRIAQFGAAGGLLGIPFAVPACFVVGFGSGLLLLLASAASFVACGYHSVRLEPFTSEVPEPDGSLSLAAQVAFDEALLATMAVTRQLPRETEDVRIAGDLTATHALFDARGWLEKPLAYHRTPPPLETPSLVRRRARGIDYEHLRFESGYEPRPDEPGRERWLGFEGNRTAHAWVVRHEGPPRPWLVCIHGYQMGMPLIDLSAFPPEYFHRHLGLNLLYPVLPLHGARKAGRRSGDGFISGDVVDTIHAEAQAMWDIRRLVGWLRSEHAAPAIGVLGLSLGGYNAALLACLADDLACVVPGIPLTDFSRAIRRHGPPLFIERAERGGVDEAKIRDVLRVVSPLVLEPRVPFEHRHIFGAVADRLVPPDQVRDLWLHWQRPELVWYQGGHLSFRLHAGVRNLVKGALEKAGLLV